MFASRLNQENVIHQQQTMAAVKNRDVGGVGAKTSTIRPTKTPSKTQPSDENMTTLAVPKGNIKSLDLNSQNFVTPAGPRVRAPLGVKTTNAKARQAAPLVTEGKAVPVKPSSPRLRRPKITIHEPTNAGIEDSSGSHQNDIEYMPPKESPLPDYPDEIWPHDREYPQLKGHSMARGWFTEYRSREGHDMDEDALSDLDQEPATLNDGRAKEQSKGSYVAPAKSEASSTLKARRAAVLLADSSTKSLPIKRSAKTANARSISSALPGHQSHSASTSNFRSTGAHLASRNTIGYSRGRTLSSVARNPLLQADAKRSSKTPSQKIKRSKLDELLGGLGMSSDDEDENLSTTNLVPNLGDEDGATDFQLEHLAKDDTE